MLIPSLSVSNGVVSFAMNYYRNMNDSDIRIDFALHGLGEIDDE